MRLIFSLLSCACALACTVDNPAFLTATAADTTGATSSASASASTGGGGSTVDPTTSAPTTGTVGTSGDVSSGVTDGNTTPPDMTTSGAGTSTTDAVSTSEPASSTGGVLDMGGPMMCAIEDLNHVPAPFLRPVNALAPNEVITGATCSQFAGVELGGRLFIYTDGFSVKNDPNCGSKLDQPSMKFPLPWQLDNVKVGGNNSCVTFKFSSYPKYADHCAIGSVAVFKVGVPLLAGRFGTAEFGIPIVGALIEAVPKGLCACPGCCPQPPDPDTYLFKLGANNEVPQGAVGQFFPNQFLHYFVNFRSDVHPECPQDPDVPNWLHFDWIVARAAG